MKQTFCLFLAALLLFCSAGCKPKDETTPPDTEQEQQQEQPETNERVVDFALPFPIENFYNEEIVLPPARVGTDGTMLVHYEKEFSFDVTLTDSDAIARVRIENWLGEDNDYNDITFYRASVLQCYQGTIDEHIILKQSGSSRMTIQGDVLFTYGNELVLFLRKYKCADTDAEFYVITGSYQTVLHVSYINEKRYLMSSIGTSFNTSLEEAIGNNYYQNPAVSPAAHAYLKEQDSYLEKEFRYIFAEEDFKNLIDRQEKGE